MFDKTGTLTEDGLSVLGFQTTEVPKINDLFNPESKHAVFKEFTPESGKLAPTADAWWNYNQEKVKDYRNLTSTLFLEGLASCHAITEVHGNLIGDPLDVQMFKSTNWVLDETQTENFADESMIVAYVYPKDNSVRTAS